jgi:hypothetical protein
MAILLGWPFYFSEHRENKGFEAPARDIERGHADPKHAII